MRDLSTLLCVGIALAPAFKMRFWNMRRRGPDPDRRPDCRPHAWCIRATICRCRCCLPPWRWAALPRAHCGASSPRSFKARWNTNETLFTLMMNYVATGPSVCLHDQHPARLQASSLGTLNQATKAGWFPDHYGPALHHATSLWSCVLTVVMYAYLTLSPSRAMRSAWWARARTPPGMRASTSSRVTVRTMADLRRDLRPVWLPDRGRQGSDHLHGVRQRARLHGHYRRMAGQVQHLL